MGVGRDCARTAWEHHRTLNSLRFRHFVGVACAAANFPSIRKTLDHSEGVVRHASAQQGGQKPPSEQDSPFAPMAIRANDHGDEQAQCADHPGSMRKGKNHFEILTGHGPTLQPLSVSPTRPQPWTQALQN